MDRKNIIAVLALSLTILPGTYAFSQTSATAKKEATVVVATVDGTKITLDEFNERAKALPEQFAATLQTPEGKSQLLDQIVNEKVLLAVAKKDGIEKTPEFKTQTEAARNQILAGLYIQNKIPQTIEVSDDDAFQFFTNNPNQFRLPERRNIQQILVATEAEANRIASSIRAGAAMDSIAKATSLDPNSGPNGGFLGWISNGQTVAEFNQAAFSAASNEVVVARTQFGFHVIKVLEIQVAQSVDFPQSKAAIKTALSNQRRQEMLNKKIEDGRKEFKVTLDASKL